MAIGLPSGRFDQLSEDALRRALSLSCWVAPENAQLLEGGITNFNVKLTDQGQDYVVRLGEDIPPHMVMRWNELAISRAAHTVGLSPEVTHFEPGVLVLRFVDAKALSAEDLHDANTLKSAVELVKTLHDRGTHALQGAVLTFWVFHILRSYAAFLREHGSSHVPKLSDLLDQAAELEHRVGPVNLVLGHNDLLPANLLKGSDRMWLIDWEYGGLNSPLFDLGGLATNAGLTKDAEEAMLGQYFGTAPDKALWQSYTAMKCASLLRETMWSMVSEITSALDFDYSEYTRENLDNYTEAYRAFTSGTA